jgi:phosphoribosyl-ATP pyrophosphohydrolase/phosphoribosyl-AMP cyclohydrolase
MNLEQRIPVLYLPEGFDEETLTRQTEGFAEALCGGLLLVEQSTTDAGHERSIHFMKKLHQQVDLKLYACGNVYRFEDTKKYLYAGASVVYCNPGLPAEQEAFKEGEKRFGAEKVQLLDVLADLEVMDGITLCKEDVIPPEVITPAFTFADVKTDDKGLVPVAVQDYRTGEMLMLAYMNEEAFNETIRTGRMVYYSRSRQEQWVKGLTSGHYQYVKSMYLDCDHDTILAKVHQIGAACHTGSYSCFFNEVFAKPTDSVNPHTVLEGVMDTILDRKAHPKEGSYTNYLFDKGIDKILKKCGEEATEIVIAAKNPDKEEIKYEIADFLYHVMVLMAERGVTWEEVMRELADR